MSSSMRVGVVESADADGDADLARPADGSTWTSAAGPPAADLVLDDIEEIRATG